MASQLGWSDNPIYAMRDTMDLQARIKEAKVLGPAGAKTDLIQKLALTAQPSRKQLSIMRQAAANAVETKEKTGLAAIRFGETSKPQTAKPQREEITAKTETVYRDTSGFAAVA